MFKVIIYWFVGTLVAIAATLIFHIHDPMINVTIGFAGGMTGTMIGLAKC